MDKIEQYFSEGMNAILHLDNKVIGDIVRAIQNYSYKIMVAGNGGSSTTASHFAGDLSKTCKLNAYCLVDSGYLVTAYGNDNGFENIFSEQIERSASPGDVFIAISGSGNSQNIIEAVEMAKSKGMFIIGLTGFDGGVLKDLCDICLVVPSDHMEVIEDVHLAISHCIVTILKDF